MIIKNLMKKNSLKVLNKKINNKNINKYVIIIFKIKCNKNIIIKKLNFLKNKLL